MRPSTGSAPSGENLRCTDWTEPEDNREVVCLALGEMAQGTEERYWETFKAGAWEYGCISPSLICPGEPLSYTQPLISAPDPLTDVLR